MCKRKNVNILLLNINSFKYSILFSIVFKLQNFYLLIVNLFNYFLVIDSFLYYFLNRVSY